MGESESESATRPVALLCAAVLLLVNLAIVWPLVGVEYSAYTNSIEWAFIAIPRILVKYPFEWSWWPFWNGGLPFEASYLPFTHWITAAFMLVNGLSAGRAYHIATAALYALGGVSLFAMAYALSRKLAASFVAALLGSCFSLSCLLVPEIRADSGGVLGLRRLQAIVIYGESPHAAALTLVPLAILCFSRALTGGGMRWKIAAGLLCASIALSNAFGIVALAVALGCWLLAFTARPWWKRPATAAAIAVVSYCLVSPWLSPAMIRAIRANSATASGDFRYGAANWMALALFAAGFLALWWAVRRLSAPAYLHFFALFAYAPAATVALWYGFRVPILPQPWRYQLEFDVALVLPLVFAAAAVVDRLPRRARKVVFAVAVTALGAQAVHAAIGARRTIRAVDPTTLGEYKIATWLERNRPGERVFFSGSSAFLGNVFTDNPQVHGGQDQHTVNSFCAIVDYTVYTGTNAGARDAEYSVFWLKAFGARAISVSGPGSTDSFQPYVNPGKFDGVLPLLWRDGADSIYEVPARSPSLAHVIPATAVVSRRPVHGLDIAPVEPFVAALDDARYPVATFAWKSLSEAAISATVAHDQVVAVQVTYERGWEAWANGRRAPLRGDAIGQMVIDAGCEGPCQIWLRYTGGSERMLTRAMSAAAVLLTMALALPRIRKRRRQDC